MTKYFLQKIEVSEIFLELCGTSLLTILGATINIEQKIKKKKN